MQVWNVVHVARWKHRTQKSRQKSPSGHHRTTLSGYIFATKARVGNRKKNFKCQYVLHMSSQYGELRPTSSWERSGSLRHPCKFQRVLRLGSVTARHLAVGVSQTLRRWTEDATYVRQGDHHVGHWPTFQLNLLRSFFPFSFSCCCYRFFLANKDFQFTVVNAAATRVRHMFAQWHYHSQWSLSEAWLLLVKQFKLRSFLRALTRHNAAANHEAGIGMDVVKVLHQLSQSHIAFSTTCSRL